MNHYAITDTDLTTCRSCGATIVWAVTKDDKRMPIDAEPCEDGNVFVARTERGLTVFVPPVGTVLPGCTRHKSHFATCPDASGHRKKKTKVK